MMILQNLSKNERCWLEAYLSCSFPGKEEVIQQLKTASVTREYTKWYLSLKFHPDKSLAPAPTACRVPVIMLAHIENRAPLEFLLHVIGGYVNELEILFADSTEISDSVDITGARLEYLMEDRGTVSVNPKEDRGTGRQGDGSSVWSFVSE